jgi:hypothetical protein
MYLQKRETVKECTGGGSVGEPLMLKSDTRYLNKDIYSESVEVRKECVLWFEEFSALYKGFQAPSRLYAFNGFYTLICNCSVIDLGPLIVPFDFPC